ASLSGAHIRGGQRTSGRSCGRRDPVRRQVWAPRQPARNRRPSIGTRSEGHRAACARSYGPFALNCAVVLVAAAVYVVCQHSVVPSPITSCTVTGSVSPSVGVGRFAPFPFACTLALPAAPALSFSFVRPFG